MSTMLFTLKFKNELLHQQIQQITKVIGSLIVNEEIGVALNSQDEIDKTDVSLYGMKGGAHEKM